MLRSGGPVFRVWKKIQSESFNRHLGNFKGVLNLALRVKTVFYRIYWEFYSFLKPNFLNFFCFKSLLTFFTLHSKFYQFYT
jgi:hypothetical protein